MKWKGELSSTSKAFKSASSGANGRNDKAASRLPSVKLVSWSRRPVNFWNAPSSTRWNGVPWYCAIALCATSSAHTSASVIGRPGNWSTGRV